MDNAVWAHWLAMILTKADWHIAQLNIANSLYPREDQSMSVFFAQLDEVNALAESSPGFVWRLETETGNATDIEVGDDPPPVA